MCGLFSRRTVHSEVIWWDVDRTRQQSLTFPLSCGGCSQERCRTSTVPAYYSSRINPQEACKMHIFAKPGIYLMAKVVRSKENN